MLKIKHRIFAFILSAFVVFGTVSSQYLTVQAFDWVAPSVYLPFDGAIPYLMGLLGVAPSDNSLFSEEEYKQYLLENGYSEEDLDNENGRYADWVDDICNGTLNQASEYWTQFKSWIKSKVNPSVVSNVSMYDVYYSIFGDYTDDLGLDIQTNRETMCSLAYYTIYNNGRNITIYAFPSTYFQTFSLNSSSITFTGVTTGGATSRTFSNFDTVPTVGSVSNLTNNTYNLSNSYQYYFFGVDESALTVGTNYHLWQGLGQTISNNVYNYELIDSLSLALSNAISSSIPDVIPLPWDQIGDTVNEITDTIDSLIEQVNTGVISISAYMQAVLDLIGAIAVDTTTDLVYPQNPDKPDETIDDKTDANKENKGFTLLGLEKVFPFCIPFDVYAFMTLLVAEPVAPVINWPVYNPITQENEIITIDFSTWESVVVLFRYIFDFLFIIGLLLMARALIGGGDSA